MINLKKKIEENKNIAIAYHRMPHEALIEENYTIGWQTSISYGFNGTYSPSPQEQKANSNGVFGKLIVKFRVPLDDFLFLDYEEFSLSPLYRILQSSESNYIQDQLEYYNIQLSRPIEEIDKFPKRKNTVKIVEWIENNAKGDLIKYVNGVVYTDKDFGKVLRCFYQKLVIPISYKVDGERGFNDIPRNKEILKQELEMKIFPDKTKKELYPSWIQAAKIEDENIEVEGNEVFWRDGTWINGVWKEGTWKEGTWINGTWKNGNWVQGYWKSGTWINGTWNRGIWEDGLWKSGTWINGTWTDGVWKGGKWLGGTWRNGSWQGGEWLGGTWIKGLIFDPVLNKEVKSFVNPAEYFKDK